MKREAFHHPKFKLLAYDLGIPLGYARGVIESLWLVTGINFPRGDIGRWSDAEIAVGIDVPGDPEKLVQLLVNRRLLDRLPGAGRLFVHDWHEHADVHIQAQLARRTEYFANGAEPRIPHEMFNADARARIKAEYDRKRAARPIVPEEPREARAHVPEQSGVGPGHIPETTSLYPDSSGAGSGNVGTGPDSEGTSPGQVPAKPEPVPVPEPVPAGKQQYVPVPEGTATAESLPACPVETQSGLVPAGKAIADAALTDPIRHTRAAVAKYFPGESDEIVTQILRAAQAVDPEICDRECAIWVCGVMPDAGFRRAKGPAWWLTTLPEELDKRPRDVRMIRAFVRGEFGDSGRQEAKEILRAEKADWRVLKALRVWIEQEREAGR